MVSGRIAWASGERGTWLSTVDGGATWRSGVVIGAEDRDLRDVQAIDGDTALVMAAGSPALIWRTNDGGTTWQIVHRDERAEVFYDGMAFADALHGFAFSDPVDGQFVVIATIDGGLTWTACSGMPAPLPGEAGFAASGTSIAARGQRVWIGTGGAEPRALRSVDGGRSWSASPVPLRAGGPSRGVFSLAFRDLSNGVAVGGDYLEAESRAQNAAITADGGLTWHAVPGSSPTGYRSAVAHLQGVASPTWFAVGPSGIDVSLDGGMSWSRVASDGYHAVSFAPDEPIGWAVGAEGRIARYDATAPLPSR